MTPKKNYEVTILGIGKRPLVNFFEAHSPGYAGRLAKDKYGDWIKISGVREVQIQQDLPKSTAHQRTQRRRRRMTQEVEVTLPTWKGNFTQKGQSRKSAVRLNEEQPSRSPLNVSAMNRHGSNSQQPQLLRS